MNLENYQTRRAGIGCAGIYLIVDQRERASSNERYSRSVLLSSAFSLVHDKIYSGTATSRRVASDSVSKSSRRRRTRFISYFNFPDTLMLLSACRGCSASCSSGEFQPPRSLPRAFWTSGPGGTSLSRSGSKIYMFKPSVESDDDPEAVAPARALFRGGRIFRHISDYRTMARIIGTGLFLGFGGQHE